MNIKVTNNLGVASVKATKEPKIANLPDTNPDINTVKSQSFDSALFSAKPTGEEAFVRDTVADIVQSAHVRPTKGELSLLRSEIEKGNYEIDTQKLAANILLLVEEE